MLFFISCAFVSESDLQTRLDPDGDGILISEDCDNSLSSIGAKILWYSDLDGDGYGDAELQEYFCEDPGEGWSINDLDCDDTSDLIHPLAIDICDEIDNNCNEEIDEAQGEGIGGTLYFLDSDQDGVGIEEVTVEACSLPEGYAQTSGDCDDQNPLVNVGVAYLEDDLTLCMRDTDGDGYGDLEAPTGGVSGSDCNDGDALMYPSALETVGDGVDQDCDGVDLCFVDEDFDGFGGSDIVVGSVATSADVSNPTEQSCFFFGMADNQDDCDDDSIYTFPGAAWLDSQTLCMRDLDGDGFGSSTVSNGVDAGSDCDDTDIFFHPNAYEMIADGIDQNCDGVDACYFDGDEDGFGTLSSYADITGSPATTIDCSGVNESTSSTDCDDTNTLVFPMANELAGDEVDQDCDGTELCYLDGDHDGFSDGTIVASLNISCTDMGETTSISLMDCDDSDAFAFPGAAFLDSSTDCMRDVDGDGYGQMVFWGTVKSGSDCNDANALISPSAAEVCDGVDNDCDSLVDDADASLDTSSAVVVYADADGDGYGDPASMDMMCFIASVFVTNSDDCDDTNAQINPMTTWYEDADGDNFGSTTTTTACIQPAGFVLDSGDCDDDNAVVYPNASEVCDGVDNNCDQTIDEDDPLLLGSLYYFDLDGDGYGDANNSLQLCSMAVGMVSNADDCDDAHQGIYPGAFEHTGDGIDQDCDGLELCFVDADEDTYPSSATATSSDLTCTSVGFTPEGMEKDCDDTNPAIHPMAEESAGSIDYNCDGFESIDTSCYSSHDGSTYFLYCTDLVDWNQAQANCEDMGYQLTSIRSEDENTHIVDFLTENSWIGYRDIDNNPCGFYREKVDFRWTDGYFGFYQNSISWLCNQFTSTGYHNWDEGMNSGQPDNHNNNEDCVEIFAEIGQYNQSIGTWNDKECQSLNAYICSIRE